jgi:hypothetical protein
MPVFLGIHEFGEPLTQERMDDAWKRYSESCKKHGAKAWKVYYNLESGRTWCITEAESADVVDAAHNDESLPTKEVIEIQKLS